MMQIMFSEKKVSSEQAHLIFSFLHQYGVLLPVDKETALVPSMLSPIPTVRERQGGVMYMYMYMYMYVTKHL